MRALDAHGVEPLLVMDFANKLYDEGLTPYSDTARKAYARYAETVIARYRPQLSAVEIWNEYNGSFCKGPCEKDRPHYYTEMLKQARSEEHTSELQSLMRISYAVFCLKKKKQHIKKTKKINNQ